jgi:hypothetical protein
MAKKKDEQVTDTLDPIIQQAEELKKAVAVKKETIKVYQSIYALRLSFPFYMDGKRVEIQFVGGYQNEARKIPGKYQTTSEKIQKELESNPEFNKSYRLISTQEVIPMVPDVVIKERLKIKTVLAEIKTCQEARDYLLSHFTLVPETLQNKPAILSVADKLNIIFPKIV